MLIKKNLKKTEFKNPTILVGLPGIANIGRITVDFLVEKLEAEKVVDYYSKSFPALVIINNESNVDLPKISVYHKKIGGEHYLFVIGDMQPADEHNYELCEEFINSFKPSRIITLGGIATGERPSTTKIHVAFNNPCFVEELEKYNLIFDGNEVVSLIIGVTGVMLGLGKIMGVKGFSLLVETLGAATYFGIKESEAVLKILDAYCGFGLDLSVLKKEIRRYEQEFKKRSKLEDEIQEYILKHGSEIDPHYIG
jgi:proteasome assembly chaperone (PAC2) family protein